MRYMDRDGRYFEDETGQDKFLSWLYSSRSGRVMLKILVNPVISNIGAWFLNTKVSTFLISSFVKNNNIDLTQYKRKRYNSYNDFFTREIKPQARPIDEEPDTVISPSDGKVSAYEITDNLRFCVKNTWYSVKSLLRNQKLAKRYEGGTCVIIRLTVDNYHRYCYLADGYQNHRYYLPGVLHTVNPIANDHVPIYTENARELTVLHTKQFGAVTQIEVGALMVGRICNRLNHGSFKKGQEKGYFEFGGSTIVLLFEKDQADILPVFFANTKNDCETMVYMGDMIGKKPNISKI